MGDEDQPQRDYRAFDRLSQGRQREFQSPQGYGDAWGTSRRIKHPGLSAVPRTRSNSVLEERHLPVPSGSRFTYNKTPWNRQYFSEDRARSNSRDNDYLSDWASRMGEARSQHRVEDNHTLPNPQPERQPQPEQNTPRYIPPHARPVEERGPTWNGRRGNSYRRNVRQHTGESHPTQTSPWQRNPSRPIYPTAISEPDEDDSRPSHVIRDRAGEDSPGVDSGDWRGHSSVDGSQLYRGRPHLESSTSSRENLSQTATVNAGRIPDRRSGLNQSHNPTLPIPLTTVNSTVHTPISSPSVVPTVPSLSQLIDGDDISASLATLQTIIGAASNRNNEPEQAINDPRVVELFNRLLPVLESTARQRPDIQDNTQDSATPGPHTLSGSTNSFINVPRVPPESTSSETTSRATAVDGYDMGSPQSPHHTDRPADTIRNHRPTANVGSRFMANNILRSSISVLKGSVASVWRRRKGSRGQTPVSSVQALTSLGQLSTISNQAPPRTDRASISSMENSPPTDQVSASSSQASSPSSQTSPPVDQTSASSSQASPSPRDETIPNQNTPVQDSELRRLAEEATLLLELCMRADIDQNDHERRQLIDIAFEYILKMRGQQENVSVPTTEGEQDSIRHEESQANIDDDRTKVDASCIICFDQIADTLLHPCNHLVLCIKCCDTMGIMERGGEGHPPVPCPMCRGPVEYRIKIYRG